MDFSTTSKLSDPVFEARVNGNTALLQVRIEPCFLPLRVPCVLPLTHSYNVFVSLKANRILFDIVSIWSCSVAFEYLRERKVSYDNNAVLD